MPKCIPPPSTGPLDIASWVHSTGLSARTARSSACSPCTDATYLSTGDPLLLTVIAVDRIEGDCLVILARPQALRVGQRLTGHVVALLI